MEYLKAFVCGGAICLVGQILLSKTNLNPARILVLFVTLGVVLTALGLYEPIVEFGGAGATVPLTGFGYSLAKGTFKAVAEDGLLGAFTRRGGSYGGRYRGAAVLFGYFIALIFNPKTKK